MKKYMMCLEAACVFDSHITSNIATGRRERNSCRKEYVKSVSLIILQAVLHRTRRVFHSDVFEIGLLELILGVPLYFKVMVGKPSWKGVLLISLPLLITTVSFFSSCYIIVDWNLPVRQSRCRQKGQIVHRLLIMAAI